MRLINADYLKRMFDVACGTNRELFNIADSVYNFAIKTIDDAPTVEPTLSDEQIDKITDLLETELGYEGIRKDVSRILRGGRE